MQKKRLLKLVIIGLFALHVTSLPIVYAVFPSRIETFIFKKSITVEPEELTVLNFYVPSGKAGSIVFEFKVSKGTIRWTYTESSTCETNTDNILQFLEKINTTIDTFFLESGSGFGWIADVWAIKSTPNNVDNLFVNQQWDIFLYNENSYDKEVEVVISKMRPLW